METTVARFLMPRPRLIVIVAVTVATAPDTALATTQNSLVAVAAIAIVSATVTVVGWIEAQSALMDLLLIVSLHLITDAHLPESTITMDTAKIATGTIAMNMIVTVITTATAVTDKNRREATRGVKSAACDGKAIVLATALPTVEAALVATTKIAVRVANGAVRTEEAKGLGKGRGIEIGTGSANEAEAGVAAEAENEAARRRASGVADLRAHRECHS